VVNEGSLRVRADRRRMKEKVKSNPTLQNRRKSSSATREISPPSPRSPSDTFSSFLTHRVSLGSLVRRDYEAGEGASLFWQQGAL
jgi:hypothetical protein